jgi:hypothetical protein
VAVSSVSAVPKLITDAFAAMVFPSSMRDPAPTSTKPAFDDSELDKIELAS